MVGGTEIILIQKGPPRAHESFEFVLSAGTPPIKTRGLPGSHGGIGIGVHGTTAPTNLAATATGLRGLLHIPKGSTLTKGLKSRIDAIGNIWANTRLSGVTIIGMGNAPH